MATFAIDLKDGNGSSAITPNDVKIQDAKFSTRRKMSTNLVPRSDFSLIEFDRLQPLRITLSGTVAGSCWNSMRQHWTEFKDTVNRGKMKFYLDAERFVEVIAGNHAENFMGVQDFMRWSMTLTAENPFFQDVATTVYDTTPLTVDGSDAGSFIVNNAGDIATPLRIEISSATSLINNSCTLQNLTNSSVFSYVGTLPIGSSLDIDKGVQTYATYSVRTESADVFTDFQGDLITLEVGTNSFVFTGFLDTAIKISYRKLYG